MREAKKSSEKSSRNNDLLATSWISNDDFEIFRSCSLCVELQRRLPHFMLVNVRLAFKIQKTSRTKNQIRQKFPLTRNSISISQFAQCTMQVNVFNRLHWVKIYSGAVDLSIFACTITLL